MKYKEQLEDLIDNLLKKHRSGTDKHTWCPECQGLMEYHGRYWICLHRGCVFEISREELPGPDEIEGLIKEVKFEKRREEIKSIIRGKINPDKK